MLLRLNVYYVYIHTYISIHLSIISIYTRGDTRIYIYIYTHASFFILPVARRMMLLLFSRVRSELAISVYPRVSKVPTVCFCVRHGRRSRTFSTALRQKDVPDPTACTNTRNILMAVAVRRRKPRCNRDF